ncbi:MAG: hypothetical protein H6971_04630 [Gammaproteobacteria bacterium]|nr:hypothetical protein [Gammaproteobacteria bacterium]
MNPEVRTNVAPEPWRWSLPYGCAIANAAVGPAGSTASQPEAGSVKLTRGIHKRYYPVRVSCAMCVLPQVQHRLAIEGDQALEAGTLSNSVSHASSAPYQTGNLLLIFDI